MKTLKELVDRELKWVQPHAARREFELMDGEEIVARLRFRSYFGSFATAETGDGSWTFKRVGFWRTQVTVCAAGSDNVIATFRNSTWSGGGTLELPDGRHFRANTNLWASKYEFKSGDGASLVRYRKIGGAFHMSSWMEVPHGSPAVADLPWLPALGWYLAIKMGDDAAGAAAAGAAAAG